MPASARSSFSWATSPSAWVASLRIDPTTGRILDDREAEKLWGRTYEKGWEIRV